MVLLALVFYEWLLCLGQEVRFIWKWRSGAVTISSLVYASSRYAFLIQLFLSVLTIYPVSDLVRHLTITPVSIHELATVYISEVHGCRVLPIYGSMQLTWDILRQL